MFNQLLEMQLIDLEGWLILNYKKLNLDEKQVMLLLLVMRLEKIKVPYITPQVLTSYMSMDDKTTDRYIVGLLSKKMLSLEGNSLSAKPLTTLLQKTLISVEDVPPKKTEINLVSVFEHEFARALTPIEIETLKEWKQSQYSDQMIMDALKEATLSNVHNMRYIEKILVDWAKHGVKKSGRERVESKSSQPVKLVDYHWWEEEE